MKCRNVVRDLPSEHGKTYDRDGAKRLNRNIARMAKLVTAGVVGVFSIVLTPHAYDGAEKVSLAVSLEHY